MIITRTPMRISLGGGGTDLPAYYRKAGKGFLIAAAISKYIYIAVNRTFDDSIILKYSQLERIRDPRQARQPPTGGRVVSISLDTRTENWRHERPKVKAVGGTPARPRFTKVCKVERGTGRSRICSTAALPFSCWRNVTIFC